MTPKEKAKELYSKMFPKSGVVFKLQAKQCALVAVDEIIKALGTVDKMYWEEVKQEIEKL